jgi:4-methylaminobutanoate oxidase (formaldehyde-forming)
MHLPDDGSVEAREVTEEWACLGLWGPVSRSILQTASSSDVSNEALPYLTARMIRLNGAEVLAQRVTYVGELGWELYVAPDQAADVWGELIKAGQAFGIQPAGYKALDSLRLEKGYRYWSVDMAPTENPFEAGLGFCVRLNKGAGSTGSPPGFVGREALLKIKAAGIQRKLCTLIVDSSAVIYGGEAVYAGGNLVGRLRSAGYGYTVEKNIGYAYLPLALTALGTQLEVESFGERFNAEVAADVLYDPQGTRLR